jgi:hypothetical protein
MSKGFAWYLGIMAGLAGLGGLMLVGGAIAARVKK